MDGGATPVSRGQQPVHLLGQGVYYAYARDHDGIMYETEHLDHAPFEGPIWFSHVALVSPDLDRLVEFYSLLFDAEPNRRQQVLQIALPVQQPQTILQSMVYPLIPVMMYS